MTATKPALSATYTVKEVAAALRLNPDTILRNLATKNISPAYKIGTDWRIPAKARIKDGRGHFFTLSELLP